MRTQLIALFLATVLACSASATSCPVHDFIAGFVAGLNEPKLDDYIDALHNVTSDLVEDSQTLATAVQSGDAEAVAQAINTLAQTLGNAVIVGSEASQNVRAVVQRYVQAIEALNETVINQRILENIAQLINNEQDIQSAIQSGDYQLLGSTLAQVLQVLAFNFPTPTRIRIDRRLTEVGINTSDIITDALDVILVGQGFLERANTTVDANTYQAVLNDVTYLAILASPLLDDIEKFNITDLLRVVPALLSQGEVLRGDYNVLHTQVSQWVARDLALFNDHSRLVTAIYDLIRDSATTQANVANVETAWNTKDFEGIGHAVADLYNQVYSGLTQ